MAETVCDALARAAAGTAGLTFLTETGQVSHVLSYALLADEVTLCARRMAALGLAPGSRLGLVAVTAPGFLIAMLAAQRLGLVPCPLPNPVRLLQAEPWAAQIGRLCQAAKAALLLVPDTLLQALDGAADLPPVRSYDSLALLPQCDLPAGRPAPDSVAYVQFSSGSTADPRGIQITHQALAANCQAILRDGIGLTPADRAFSWLPFYHDMGLVGFFFAPLWGQCPVTYWSPASFARRPGLWLGLMATCGATICYAPPTAYHIAALRTRTDEAAPDLSRLRVAGIGGDMIAPDLMAAFLARSAAWGLDPQALRPSYGMAEITLAASFARGLRSDRVDRAALAGAGTAQPAAPDSQDALEFTRCGKVLPGYQVEIRDAGGHVLGPRQVGQIYLQGPSLGLPLHPATDEAPADGFLATGDLGYLADEEIVVTGRLKDLIISHGRNIWPQDVEWSLVRDFGYSEQNVAAFGVSGETGDRLVVLLEDPGAGGADAAPRAAAIAQSLGARFGIAAEARLVPPRWLPLTSSGKLSRSRAKAGYLAGKTDLFIRTENETGG